MRQPLVELGLRRIGMVPNPSDVADDDQVHVVSIFHLREDADAAGGDRPEQDDAGAAENGLESAATTRPITGRSPSATRIRPPVATT